MVASDPPPPPPSSLHLSPPFLSIAPRLIFTWNRVRFPPSSSSSLLVMVRVQKAD